MNLHLNLAARIGLNIGAILAGIAVLRLGNAIFLPLIFATFLATILWPSAVRLNTFYKFPWALSCLFAVGGLVFLNLVFVAGFMLAVPRLMQSVPTKSQSDTAQKAFYEELRKRVAAISPVLVTDENLPEDPDKSQLFATVKKTLEGDYILQALWTAMGYVSSYLWQFILILFILLFLLMEGKMLTRRLVEVFGPSSDVQGKVVSSLTAMSKVVRDFLVWRTVINLCLAAVVGLVYQFLGLRQAWVWALLTGILCYIPYIGPIIAAGPPILDALIHTSGWIALAVLVFYTGVIILEGYVIVPLLMGRHMDLNATTVMLGCIFWELVWGVPGLFLAMPLMGAIKSICEHVPGWEPWAGLMSAKEISPLPTVVRTVVAHDAEQTVIMPPTE